MSEELPTKERLARAIVERTKGKYDPRFERMIKMAREAYYDEYDGPLATPITQLVDDFRALGWPDMAQRAMDGEFDATMEEAEAWMQREGWPLIMGELGSKGKRKK